MSRSRRWRSGPASIIRKQLRTMATSNTKTPPKDYSQWSQEALAARVTELEGQLAAARNRLSRSSSPKAKPKPASKRAFDPSRYTTRHIALKFAYLGKRYNGFEHHGGHSTPLPTIEGELWKALVKCRLIFPKGGLNYAAFEAGQEEINWEGTQYSKCGRTDKGVSAFGQVIGIRVRSNRPPPTQISPDDELQQNDANSTHVEDELSTGLDNVALSDAEDSKIEFDHIADELPYPHLLNRVLPRDIRVLAWCPSAPEDFDARFSCRERRYRYFFTNPASTAPANYRSKKSVDSHCRLDIEAMQQAAKSFEGLHDFRNFCKIDGSKQITNFSRRIFRSEIEAFDSLDSSFSPLGTGLSSGHNSVVPESETQIFSFTVHGSAFLWHQIRHMIAILFLVGQKLEPVSVVRELLDVEKVPGRPAYEKATDTPLVLWDCIFPNDGNETDKGAGLDSLKWISTEDERHSRHSIATMQNLRDDSWSNWQACKIDEVLTGSLFSMISQHWSGKGNGREKVTLEPTQSQSNAHSPRALFNQRVFLGGNTFKRVGEYQSVLERTQLEAPEAINRTYRLKNNIPDPN